MMKIMLLVIAFIAGFIWYSGCSKEDRDEAINRIGKAGKALNGEVRRNDVEQEVPNIVAEQQRKERIRQNSTWTAENRALHPIEYGMAQLEELRRYSDRLETAAHEVACKKAEVTRTRGNAETKLKTLTRFLEEAKATYCECEGKNAWPGKLGGFYLSRDKFREKIVDMSKKIAPLKVQLGTQQNQLVYLEKKAHAIAVQQKGLVAKRETVENVISDLRIKSVVADADSVTASLNKIDDAMKALGVDYDDPTTEDIIAPDGTSAVDDEFDKVMAE